MKSLPLFGIFAMLFSQNSMTFPKSISIFSFFAAISGESGWENKYCEMDFTCSRFGFSTPHAFKRRQLSDFSKDSSSKPEMSGLIAKFSLNFKFVFFINWHVIYVFPISVEMPCIILTVFNILWSKPNSLSMQLIPIYHTF